MRESSNYSFTTNGILAIGTRITSALSHATLATFFLVLMIGCVSQKKYEALKTDHDQALEDLAKLNVETTVDGYDQATDNYQNSGVLYAQMEENAARLDSLRKIASFQQEELKKVKIVLNEMQNTNWMVDDIEGKVLLDLDHEVYFDVGQTTLSENGKELIERISRSIQKLKTPVNVWVVGHTDSQPVQGQEFDNWDVSMERALSVVRELLGTGVSPADITAAARSKYIPQSVNAIDPGRSLNRRTEILIIPQQVFGKEISSLLSDL